jgi:hypothetical protein
MQADQPESILEFVDIQHFRGDSQHGHAAADRCRQPNYPNQNLPAR